MEKQLLQTADSVKSSHIGIISKEKNHTTLYRNGKTIFTCGYMKLTGIFRNGCIKLQPKSADVMTQCYQQFFTQTNTTYVLHHNERKKTFRKLILQSSTLFPCTQNKDLVVF